MIQIELNIKVGFKFNKVFVFSSFRWIEVNIVWVLIGCAIVTAGTIISLLIAIIVLVILKGKKKKVRFSDDLEMTKREAPLATDGDDEEGTAENGEDEEEEHLEIGGDDGNYTHVQVKGKK